MTDNTESRAAAQRLLAALPKRLPTDEERSADVVQAALLDSGLLAGADLGSSPAVAAAARHGLTSLAHLLDTLTGGYGAGQLVLLVLAEREGFTPHPAPDPVQLRARAAATALLNLSLWHTDDPIRLLYAAMQAHAEEARDVDNHGPSRSDVGSVRVTEGLTLTDDEVHLTIHPLGDRGALSICGLGLDAKAEGSTAAHRSECARCFGRTAVSPAPILTGREHDAWTAYIADRNGRRP